MWFTVYILAGCYLPMVVLGQPDPLPKDCGKRPNNQTPPGRYQPRKTEAPPNSWPWHVGVYSAAFGPFPFCGGTLITPRWVLTSAHCIVAVLNCTTVQYGRLFSYDEVTKHQMAVLVGAHKHRPDEPLSSVVRVKGVIMHSFFLPYEKQTGYDVALLQLASEVKQSSHIEYACLPEHDLVLPAGHFCNVVGWGQIPDPPNAPKPGPSQTLMELRIPIAWTSDCKDEWPYMNEDEDVCTDGAYGMPCKGDSGGGLHCLTENGWVVYGVASYGNNNCFGGYHVFSLTTPKINWIKRVIVENP